MANFPYAPSPIEETHVQFPPTTHSRLQEQSLRVNLLITNYPIEFWHPLYFKYLTSPMGSLLYITDQNAKGDDRSSLRLTIQCIDPARIPKAVVVHHEGKWRRCRVLVKGWSFDGDPLPDSPGPWRMGQMQDSDSQEPLDWQRDWVLRLTMADARSNLISPTHQGAHGATHHQSHRSKMLGMPSAQHEANQKQKNSFTQIDTWRHQVESHRRQMVRTNVSVRRFHLWGSSVAKGKGKEVQKHEVNLPTSFFLVAENQIAGKWTLCSATQPFYCQNWKASF